jgi:hypothetical protein
MQLQEDKFRHGCMHLKAAEVIHGGGSLLILSSSASATAYPRTHSTILCLSSLESFPRNRKVSALDLCISTFFLSSILSRKWSVF